MQNYYTRLGEFRAMLEDVGTRTPPGVAAKTYPAKPIPTLVKFDVSAFKLGKLYFCR